MDQEMSGRSRRNIVIVSFSVKKGGAGIAASRYISLLAKNIIRSKVFLISQDSAGKFQLFKRLISYVLCKLQFDGNPIKHSLNLFSYAPVIESFEMQSQFVHHLHWINNDTLSVFDFKKIPSGSILTLHDEWLYCGTEHCYKISEKFNYNAGGYPLGAKGVYGIPWNRIIWKVKYKNLVGRDDLIFTVPSNWMLERAKSSALLRGADVRLLPNAIDTCVFKPYLNSDAYCLRSTFGIDSDCFIFAFGAVGGIKNSLKGGDLLEEAFSILGKPNGVGLIANTVLVEFGGVVGETNLHGFRRISIGHIRDPVYLAMLYSMADCVIVPSMVESFGQVAAEALACETPVVCFDTSGLKDIVVQGRNGILARAFDARSLADSLRSIINCPKQDRLKLGQFGREHVMKNFSFPIVAKRYVKILDDAAEMKKMSRL